MSKFASRLRVDAALMRADAADAASVFTLRLDKEARAFADAADVSHLTRSHTPLLGMRATVKDNFDLAGYPTTAGSKVLADAPAAKTDAAVVSRLRRVGCVILGRTNMTEFAFSGLGLNPHYGTPINPAFPGEARIPGGSSSGAAVSVALGIAPIAIGTDTGGSIRIPAALCGLSGFKPTASAVSREGVLPLSTTLDTVGVIARTAKDCATMFDVIRDTPAAARPVLPARRIRLGVVTNYVTDAVSPEVQEVIARSIALLEAAGVSIEPIVIGELDAIPEMMNDGTFAAAEAFAWHSSLLGDGRQGEYDPRVLVRIEAGEAMTASAYVRLIEHRRNLIDAVGRRSAGLDAFLWPTVPFIAPAIDSLADDSAYHAANALALRNSTVVNLIDGCAISIPCPVESAPVGLTLAAGSGRDDWLLSVAATLQSLLAGA